MGRGREPRGSFQGREWLPFLYFPKHSVILYSRGRARTWVPNCTGDRATRTQGRNPLASIPAPAGPAFSNRQFILGKQVSLVGSGAKTKHCSRPGAWPLHLYPSAWGHPASAPVSPTSHRHQQQGSSFFLPSSPTGTCLWLHLAGQESCLSVTAGSRFPFPG